MGNCQYLLAESTSKEQPYFRVEVQHLKVPGSKVSRTEHFWFSFYSKDDLTGENGVWTIYGGVTGPSVRSDKYLGTFFYSICEV